MRERIVQALHDIEREEQIKILYACESGSRAWGFASEDSDYDVRFIYVHPRDWYLRIDVEADSDVVERPIVDELDLSGWDLRKALGLMKKSNPPLLEWLNSPIVYLEESDSTRRLKELLPEFYSPIACRYHYYNMAVGNYREFLKAEQVWLKKYLYVLRPLLAIRWIEEEREPIPMEFDRLVARIVVDKDLLQAIEDLLKTKKAGKEVDRGPKVPAIHKFIEAELARFDSNSVSPGPKPDIDKLNALFRSALQTL